jgi:hypothetical protein
MDDSWMSWLSGLVSNLIADMVWAVVTIFVIDKAIKRAERRSLERQRQHEEQERLRREHPIWEELQFIFGESLEGMARVWTPVLPDEDRPTQAPFFVPKLKEKLRSSLMQPFERGALSTPAYISRLAETVLREASKLFQLHTMFPSSGTFIKDFLNLDTWIDSLRKNAEALERIRRSLAEAQGDAEQRIKQLEKALYSTKGAVLTHAWQVFEITERISTRIDSTVDDVSARLVDTKIAESST